ncbi:MarR family transcriptional regulator, partial [Xanthobacter flavus]
MTKDGGGSRGISPGLSNRLFFRLYQCANMLHKTGTRAL